MTEAMNKRVNELCGSEEFANALIDNGNALREKYLNVEANTDFESICRGYAVCHESCQYCEDTKEEKALYEACRAYKEKCRELFPEEK